MVQVGLWLGLFFLISLVYFFKKYSGEKKGIVFKEKKKVIIICFCLWLGSCGSFKIDSALKKAKDEKDRKESAKKYLRMVDLDLDLLRLGILASLRFIIFLKDGFEVSLGSTTPYFFSIFKYRYYY